jgi:hypothetical protein
MVALKGVSNHHLAENGIGFKSDFTQPNSFPLPLSPLSVTSAQSGPTNNQSGFFWVFSFLL